MKKNIFKTVLCAAFAAVALTSCELDQFPQGSIVEDESWEQPSDAKNYYYGLLSAMRSCSGGSSWYVQDLMTDEFNMTKNATSNSSEHGWSFTGTQFSGDVIWANNFSLVGYCNQFLNNVDRIPVEAGSSDESTILNYKGFAYMARAYAYMNMIPRYCKEYEQGANASAPGLPLVTKTDINAKPSRATLEETFQFVLKDIAAADSLLQSRGNTNYPGLDCLRCIEARIRFMMGGKENWERVIEITDELLEDYPLITKSDAFKNLWTTDAGTEVIYSTYQDVPNEQGKSWGIYKVVDEGLTDNTGIVYCPDFLPTQGLYDMYLKADYRRDIYFDRPSAGVSRQGTTKCQRVYIFNKYPGNPKLIYSSQYDIYNACKVFRSAHFVLMAAESAFYLNDEDLAIEYINELRKARGLTKSSQLIDSTGDDLLADIKTEWTLETVGEGFRLNNLKRWHDGFTRMAYQKNALEILDQTRQELYLNRVIESDNTRFLWEIPQQELQANPNIVRNW